MLVDESGFFLNPLVRRTWAKRGQTPTLRTWGRHRDKVSVAAALSVAPRHRRLGLYFRTDAKHYFNGERIALFLREEVLLAPARRGHRALGRRQPPQGGTHP